MMNNAGKRDRWHLRMPLLRVAAIVLPLLFLATIQYLGHFVFPQLVHTLFGFFALMVIVAVAVVLFSHFVFTLIERAERRALSRHQELLTLNTVAAAASQPMKLEELLQIAVDGVMEALGLDGGIACILDEKNRELLHVAYRGIPDHLLGPMKKAKLEAGQIHTDVVTTGEPIQVRDISLDPRFREGRYKAFFRSVITLPLKSEGKVKGVLALVSRSPRTFEPPQVQFLLTLGGQLAVAIERTQLQRQVANMAVLEERERIAREMHDGLAQVLGYINTQVLALRRLVLKQDTETVLQQLAEMQEASQRLYADVREGILGLRTSPGDSGGLVPALEDFLERYRSMVSFQVSLEVSPEARHQRLQEAAQIQLQRIIQEALSNVRKHARAQQAVVSLRNANGEFQVEIADDGIGFDPAVRSSIGWPRFGLQTMRERAEAVGCKFAIESAPGRGTRVVVKLPADQAQ